MGSLRRGVAAAAGSDPAELPSNLLDGNKEGVSPTPTLAIHETPIEGLPTIQSETEDLAELLASRPRVATIRSESKVLSDDGHLVRTDPRSHSQRAPWTLT